MARGRTPRRARVRGREPGGLDLARSTSRASPAGGDGAKRGRRDGRGARSSSTVARCSCSEARSRATAATGGNGSTGASSTGGGGAAAWAATAGERPEQNHGGGGGGGAGGGNGGSVHPTVAVAAERGAERSGRRVPVRRRWGLHNACGEPGTGRGRATTAEAGGGWRRRRRRDPRRAAVCRPRATAARALRRRRRRRRWTTATAATAASVAAAAARDIVDGCGFCGGSGGEGGFGGGGGSGPGGSSPAGRVTAARSPATPTNWTAAVVPVSEAQCSATPRPSRSINSTFTRNYAVRGEAGGPGARTAPMPVARSSRSPGSLRVLNSTVGGNESHRRRRRDRHLPADHR